MGSSILSLYVFKFTSYFPDVLNRPTTRCNTQVWHTQMLARQQFVVSRVPTSVPLLSP